MSETFNSCRSFYLEKVFPAAVFLLTLCLKAEFVFRHVSFLGNAATAANIMAVICEAVVFFVIVFARKTPGLIVLFLNALWMLLSRMLLHDMSLPFAATACGMSFIVFALYAGGCCTGEKHCKTMMKILYFEMAALLSAVSAVGILTAVSGHSVFGIDGIIVQTESSVPPLVFVEFFGIHRNISAMYFVCASGMMLFGLIKERNVFTIAATVITLPLFFVSAALQHCRSAYLAFAVVISILIFYALRKRTNAQRPFVKMVAISCAALLCAVLIYGSFGLCSKAMMDLSQDMRISEETQLDPEQFDTVSDNRSTLSDAPTLTGRTDIWKAAIDVIKEQPGVLLFGQAENDMMDLVNEKTASPFGHMHNSLMQQLMLSGAPGFILYTVFFALLLKRSAAVLLSKESAGNENAVLAAVLLGVMAYGVLEPMLSYFLPFVSMFFALASGVFCRRDNTAEAPTEAAAETQPMCRTDN